MRSEPSVTVEEEFRVVIALFQGTVESLEEMGRTCMGELTYREAAQFHAAVERAAAAADDLHQLFTKRRTERRE